MWRDVSQVFFFQSFSQGFFPNVFLFLQKLLFVLRRISVFKFFQMVCVFFFQRFVFQMVLTQQMVLKVFFLLIVVLFLQTNAFLQILSQSKSFFVSQNWFLLVKSILLEVLSHKRKRLNQKVFFKKGVSLGAVALRAENVELGTHYESRVNVLTSAEVADL